MNSVLEDKLSQTMAKTLEDLTFCFATPEPWQPPILDDEQIALGVHFGGHWEGYLGFICPVSAGRAMTVNMLGLDDDETVAQTQIHDALKEVLNIICGNILPVLAGTDAVFDISAPQVVDLDQGATFGRPLPPALKTKLDLEGQPSYLFVFLEDPLVIGS